MAMAALALALLLSISAATSVAAHTLSAAGLQVFNVFLHEDPTSSYFVVPPIAGHGGNFGALVVIDQPFTVSPDRTSQEIGRAKGLAAFSNNGNVGAPEILYTMNFDDPRAGGFGQSSLSFRGSNNLALAQRELAIVGGTGQFRLAEGFAFVQTYSWDQANRLATANFTLFVRTNPLYTSYLLQET